MRDVHIHRRAAVAVVVAFAALQAALFAAGWLLAITPRPAQAITVRSRVIAAAVLAPREPQADVLGNFVRSFLTPREVFGPPAPPAPRRAPYWLLIHNAAQQHGLPPLLVEAVARVESDFNAREVSYKGAVGIMQVMPETGLRFGVRRHELFDPERNIAAGTAYLAWLLKRYRGNLDLALAAYNAGEGAVDQYRGIPPYRETQQYVRRVRAALNRPAARTPPSS